MSLERRCLWRYVSGEKMSLEKRCLWREDVSGDTSLEKRCLWRKDVRDVIPRSDELTTCKGNSPVRDTGLYSHRAESDSVLNPHRAVTVTEIEALPAPMP
jgi:hypothetical protein